MDILGVVIEALNLVKTSYEQDKSKNEKEKEQEKEIEKEKEYRPCYIPKDKQYDNENTLKMFVGNSKDDAVLITELKDIHGNVFNLSKPKNYKNPIVNPCFGRN